MMNLVGQLEFHSATYVYRCRVVQEIQKGTYPKSQNRHDISSYAPLPNLCVRKVISEPSHHKQWHSQPLTSLIAVQCTVASLTDVDLVM